MPSRFYRRISNRLATLNLLALCVLVGVWIPVQIYPVFASWPVLEPEIHYGTPHYARETPLLNKVVFRMNGDNGADYMLWMDGDNQKAFLDWFGPGRPMEVWSLRISPHTWFVTDVQTAEGGLEPYGMYVFQLAVAGGGAVLTLLSWALFAFFLREYMRHFRHKRWLAVGPEAA